MSYVITYTCAGLHLALSEDQVTRLRAAGLWPRNERGFFTAVMRGASRGYPDLTEDEFSRLLAGEEVRGLVAR